MIRNIKRALLSLNRQGQHNWTKIVCLGIGLAAGAVLIAKVCFEQSYDTFAEGADRIYRVNEKIIRDGDVSEYPQTSGAIAPGIMSYSPQVEAATRFFRWGDGLTLMTEGRKQLSGSIIMADSCFFDIFTRTILNGNVKDVLRRPWYCLVSRSMAGKLDGDPIGQKLTVQEAGNRELVIGGVYEDFPLNSCVSNTGVVLSLESIKNPEFDGTQNWNGNDMYRSFIRLRPGCRIEDIRGQVNRMCKEKLPQDELKKSGVGIDFTFTALTTAHTSDPDVKRMSWILSLLALLLVFSAVMNYLLIVIGGISGRAQEMAVHRCYGAGSGSIYSMLGMEGVVHLALSLCLAAALIYASKGTVEELVSAPVTALLSGTGGVVVAIVCVIVLLVTALIPGWIYSSVPVVSAFRGYSHSHRLWKLGLLALQFATVSFLLCLLVVISRQYSLMRNYNPGYEYSNIVHVGLFGVPQEKREVAYAEIQKMAGVESVTTTEELPVYARSGNNIYLPGDDREYMNITDLYAVSNSYVKTMGIRLLQGRNFTENTDTLGEVMVSRSFVERMKTLAGWDGNAIGRRILVSDHSDWGQVFTVCGVYEDISTGTVGNSRGRQTVMFYRRQPANNFLVKFKSISGDDIEELRRVLKRVIPDREFMPQPYTTIMANEYRESYRFRTTVMIGSIVTLLIAIIGLIGYTNDETSRRHKEIAIRKVNGAETRDIMRLFVLDILRVAIPSLAAGAVGAFAVARIWLEQFNEKTTLSAWLFLGGVAVLIAVVIAVVNANCRRVARSNPAGYLKK